MFIAAQLSRWLPKYPACILLAVLPQMAWAQNMADRYPSKPVRLVVPFAPGASTDMVARLLGQKTCRSVGPAVHRRQPSRRRRGGRRGNGRARRARRLHADGHQSRPEHQQYTAAEKTLLYVQRLRARSSTSAPRR